MRRWRYKIEEVESCEEVEVSHEEVGVSHEEVEVSCEEVEITGAEEMDSPVVL